MKRTFSFIDEKGEEQFVEIECCEGEEKQIGCELKCQRVVCPLYVMAVDLLYSHETVLEEARRLSEEGE